MRSGTERSENLLASSAPIRSTEAYSPMRRRLALEDVISLVASLVALQVFEQTTTVGATASAGLLGTDSRVTKSMFGGHCVHMGQRSDNRAVVVG